MTIKKKHKEAETKRFSFFILSVSTVASSFIGLASTIILASNFGTGPEMDAFLIALVVPKTLSSILMTCLAMLAVPRFVKVRERLRGEISVATGDTNFSVGRYFLVRGVNYSRLTVRPGRPAYCARAKP